MGRRNSAPPLFLQIMARSKESDLSQQFILDQKRLYGPDLKIEKVIKPLNTGEPDIFSIFRGMPLYAESKSINPISLTNIHPFKKIQIQILEENAKSKAISIGLLLMDHIYKYITYDKLHEHITPQEYKNAKIFNYEEIYEEWKKMII